MNPEIVNKQWIYRKRPSTFVGPENYELTTQIISTVLAGNEVLIKAKYISVDPYMRVQQSSQSNWEAPHPLNCIQGASVVGKVLKSNSPAFDKDDLVLSYSGWQTYAIVHAAELTKLNFKEAPPSAALSVLGMPGRTAWFGLTEAGRPKAGETIVVSGAAGAVGSLVVQFAKFHGTKVIAIAGSEEKCNWLTKELDANHALNYKDYNDNNSFSSKLRQLCDGVDVYFDNVGGWITDAIIPQINRRARIVICGQITQYSGALDEVELGPRFLHHLIYQRATIQGILARDYAHRMDEMLRIVLPMLQSGQLKYRETYVDGFEQLPHALSMLFSGENIGKLIVRIED